MNAQVTPTTSQRKASPLKKLLRLSDRLFPEHCVLCNQPGVLLCGACLNDSRAPLLTTCPQCAIPLHHNGLCGTCLSDPPHFDHTLAAAAYSAPFDQLILGLKFHAQLALASLFADLLLARMQQDRLMPTLDVLIPLPLNSARWSERGFNQALEIARPLGKSLGIRVEPDWVVRVIDTPHQASLPLKSRSKNMRGAFAVCDSAKTIQDLRIGVIDDVMTTGSTLNEMAKVLKRAGAASVTNLVVARTP